ncbi:MAG: MFS transporter [Chitinophagaceae bacterium]
MAGRWPTALGRARLILFGVLIRAVSFVVMGFATVPWLLLLSGLLAALGGALFDAPIRATLATLAPEEELTAVYGRLGILQNVARTIGPLIGAYLIRFDFQMVGLAAAAFFLLAFFITLLFLPPISVCSEAADGARRAAAGRRRPVVRRLHLTHDGLLVHVGAVVHRHAAGNSRPDRPGQQRRHDVHHQCRAGHRAASAGAARDGAPSAADGDHHPRRGRHGAGDGADWPWARAWSSFYVGLFFFSLGTVLAMPNAQTVTAEMSDERARGAYFGVSSLAMAVGGGLGHILGGTLVDVAAARGTPALPWLVFAGAGLLSAVGLSAVLLVAPRRPAAPLPRHRLRAFTQRSQRTPRS